MEATKKVFSLYYKNNEQKLVVYNGTPQSEVINSIKQVLNIPNESGIRFLDEDGIPIVISSSLPDQIKLFVSTEDEVVEKINQTNQTQTQENRDWIWIPDQSQIRMSDKLIKTQDVSVTKAYGSIKFEKGQHYWRIKIGKLYCCQDFGICSGQINNFRQGAYQTENQSSIKGLPSVIPNRDCGPGSTGCSSLNISDCIYGFYLDMDQKKFIIVNENENMIYRKTKFNFNTAIPFVYSCKHSNSFEIIDCFTIPPEWLTQQIPTLEFEEPIVVYQVKE